MGLNTFVYALVLVTLSHNSHGKVDGLTREHVATYATEGTCQLARRSWQYYTPGPGMYFCQKEMVK